MAGTQFNAQEAGRGFGEQLASSQGDFAQRLGSGQFNAAGVSPEFRGEDGQRKPVLQSGSRLPTSSTQAQHANMNQAYTQQNQFADQFNAGERQFGSGQNLGAQGQLWGQGFQQRGQNLGAQNQALQPATWPETSSASQRKVRASTRASLATSSTSGPRISSGVRDSSSGVRTSTKASSNGAQDFNQALARDQFGLGAQNQFWNQGFQTSAVRTSAPRTSTGARACRTGNRDSRNSNGISSFRCLLSRRSSGWRDSPGCRSSRGLRSTARWGWTTWDTSRIRTTSQSWFEQLLGAGTQIGTAGIAGGWGQGG